MKNLVIVSLVSIFLITACGDINTGNTGYVKGVTRYDAPINYFKDERTGICFAERVPIAGDSYSFTEVPCEKVDALYKKNTHVNSNSIDISTNTNTNTNKGK